MKDGPNMVFSDQNGEVPDPKRIGVLILGLADETPDAWIDTATKILTDMQKAWPKDTKVVIAYSGYDKVPCNLWDIEMPARKLAKLSKALWFAGFPKDRLEYNSSLLLMACDTTAAQFEAGAGHA